MTAQRGRTACGPPGPPPGSCGAASLATSAGLRLGGTRWPVHTQNEAGSSAVCTTLARSSRTASRSTASLSRAANAATVVSASYLSRGNLNPVQCLIHHGLYATDDLPARQPVLAVLVDRGQLAAR